jgi:uncharacterized protein YhaN
MSSKAMIIKKLHLEGFGLYERAVNALYKEGVNHYVAHNERGKSTLVNGVLAVIYGLTHGQYVKKEEEFNTARFRNWNDPSKFEGELEFLLGGIKYRISRNFENHKISFLKHIDDGWIELAQGVHNPAGKVNEKYEKALKDVLKITTKELFAKTFCINQPFPDGRLIDTNVQELLSGGGLDFNSVKASLEDQLQVITKYTGGRGVKNNKRNNRILEDIREEIKVKKEKIHSVSEAIDSMELVQTKLIELQQKLTEIEIEKINKEKVLEGLTEWFRLKDNYFNGLDRQNRINTAFEKTKELTEKIFLLEREGDSKYNDLKTIGESLKSLEVDLEQLKSLTHSINSYQNQITSLEKEIEDDQRKQSYLEEELKGFRNWKLLIGDPETLIKNMKVQVKGLLAQWELFENKLSRVNWIKETLKFEFKAFEEAEDEELNILEGYERTKLALEISRDSKDNKLKDIEKEMFQYERAREYIKSQYNDILGFSENSTLAVKRKLELLERERKLEKNLNIDTQKIKKPSVLPVIGAVFVAALTGLLFGFANLTITIPWMTVVGLIGYFVIGKIINSNNKTVVKGEEELSDIRKEYLMLNEDLKDTANYTEGQLGVLIERLRQRDLELDRLKTLEDRLPTQEDQDNVKTQYSKAKTEYDRFLTLTKKFDIGYQSLEEAFINWKGLKKELQSLEWDIDKFSYDNFGCNANTIKKSSPLELSNGSWREVAEFLAVTQGIALNDFNNWEMILNLMEDFNENWWVKLMEDGRGYTQLIKDITELNNAQKVKGQQRENIHDKIKKLWLMKKVIYNKHKVILDLDHGDIVKTKERIGSYKDLIRKINENKAVMEGIFDQFKVESLEELQRKKTNLDNQTQILLVEWSSLIKNNPGLPTVGDCDDIERIQGIRLKLIKEKEEITKIYSALSEEQRDLLREQSRLEGKDIINIAEAEIELEDLIEKENELDLLADALAEAYKEIDRSVSDYQDEYRIFLQNLITKHFIKISGITNRKVIVDKEFSLKLLADGREVEVYSLSKGAQDQLYLSLRFAIGDLLAENTKLPFIFDDPFVSSDDNRLRNIKAIVEEMANERQIIILSHRKDFEDWGTPIQLTSGT